MHFQYLGGEAEERVLILNICTGLIVPFKQQKKSVFMFSHKLFFLVSRESSEVMVGA